MTISVGEAAMRLLAKYGIDTVFGIPGVHTLEFYRGLGDATGITHVQARNEMGAGFMADGYGRVTGKPGVALLISGPGVTNATTPLGQAYADSVPMIVLSADAQSDSLGKGWGVLHEVTDLHAVTAPLTALSLQVRAPEDVPQLFAQAFSIFASERPRPVHISIPLDILSMQVVGDWEPVTTATRPQPASQAIEEAAKLLGAATHPLIMVGGGAAGANIQTLAECLSAPVMSSTAGKGILPDTHPLSLGGATVRPEAQRFLAQADVILAIGTELSETDSFVERLEINGTLIRIDIDARKINDLYPASVGIVGDAAPAVEALVGALRDHKASYDGVGAVASVKAEVMANLSDKEHKHLMALNILRDVLPEDCIVMADACQIVYTGAFAFPVNGPCHWHYAAGYCPLGYALPNAIGAKLADPERPVAVFAGDGGFMFTVQELATAAELKLSLPIIVWDNQGLQEIRDDMLKGNISRVGVDGVNPDFLALARAMGCEAIEPHSSDELARATQEALNTNRPTLILINEQAEWLVDVKQLFR